MVPDPIKAYLKALERDLWMRGLSDEDTLAEIEGHLLEAVEEGQKGGLSLEEAQRQALERFGSAKIIGTAFEKERIAPMQKILLVSGVLAGLFLAYLDSLPNWDDTGILVIGLLLSSGLLALLGYKRPWLLALAIGLWIPLHDIYLTHDLRMLFVFIFPFVGAYLGWAVHLLVRKTMHPA
jgi:hypothetical protein